MSEIICTYNRGALLEYRRTVSLAFVIQAKSHIGSILQPKHWHSDFSPNCRLCVAFAQYPCVGPVSLESCKCSVTVTKYSWGCKNVVLYYTWCEGGLLGRLGARLPWAPTEFNPWL